MIQWRYTTDDSNRSVRVYTTLKLDDRLITVPLLDIAASEGHQT